MEHVARLGLHAAPLEAAARLIFKKGASSNYTTSSSLLLFCAPVRAQENNTLTPWTIKFVSVSVAVSPRAMAGPPPPPELECVALRRLDRGQDICLLTANILKIMNNFY